MRACIGAANKHVVRETPTTQSGEWNLFREVVKTIVALNNPTKKETAETAATVRRRVAFRKTQTPSANSLTERLPERKKNLFL